MSPMHITKRILAAVFAAALMGCLMLTGCAQTQSQQPANQEEAGPTSQSFMSDMNMASAKLQEKMDGFADAVSREDLVSMQMQADAAYGAIDDMAAVEAPEELSDLKQRYVDACGQLKEALSQYVALYQEIKTATTRAPFDYSTYADRIAQVQTAYDAGLQALKDADQAASEM